MRFEETLNASIYQPWRDNYIDYGKLKKLLREEDEPSDNRGGKPRKDVWTEEDEGAFVEELVNVQLEKVHAFHKDTYEKSRDRTAKCEARLDDVAVSGKAQVNGDNVSGGSGSNGKKALMSEDEKKSTLKEVLDELDEISKEINELEKYSRINYSGFLKAAKKHDRKRGQAYRVTPLLKVRLAALPFNKEDYSPLLYRLSAMYSFVRQHLDGAEGKPPRLSRGMSVASAQAKGRDEYLSHKFWVHPENLLEVKTMVLRRLPVLVYNPQTSKIAEGNQPDPSITSIYFDNPDFSLYSHKVDEGEASTVRMRWYGQLNAKPEIWVEKKIVKEDGTSAESRFAIKEKYVQRFINREYKMQKQIQKLEDRAGKESVEAQGLRDSVDEIQNFITEYDLQPVLRANYTRTAFQIPGDDKVRISLDNDIAFIREDAIDQDRPCRDPESWHRADIDAPEMSYPFTSIRKGEVNRFPFALLEIKVRTTSGRIPEWIEDLMSSHLIKDAPRFSKFVHGVAVLFEDYVNTFPFWLSDMETDIRRDPQQAFEEEQAKKQKERDDEFAVGSLLPASGKDKKSPMVRSHGNAILSPVGSPVHPHSYKRTSNTTASKNGKQRDYGTVSATPTQQDAVVEEPDDDETGAQAHGTENQTSSSSGLKSLFPSFSTSKYAQARRQGRTRLPPGVEKPENWIKDQGPVKVEAKVWLANQRTFIKWQHVSVLLASLSLGLYNAAGVNNNIARTLAVVYTAVAVFAAAWGYFIYMWRTNLIQRRSGKDFDAVTGPVVVCVGLIIALVLNFGFKYHAAIQQRDKSGASSILTMNSTEYVSRWS